MSKFKYTCISLINCFKRCCNCLQSICQSIFFRAFTFFLMTNRQQLLVLHTQRCFVNTFILVRISTNVYKYKVFDHCSHHADMFTFQSDLIIFWISHSSRHTVFLNHNKTLLFNVQTGMRMECSVRNVCQHYNLHNLFTIRSIVLLVVSMQTKHSWCSLRATHCGLFSCCANVGLEQQTENPPLL